MPPADAAAGPHAPAADVASVLAVLKEVSAARIAVDEPTAARLSGLSAKTLQRAALSGERTGRRRVGSRVVYYLPELSEWIKNLPTN